MTVSDDFKAAAFAKQTDEVWTTLITITADSLPTPIRLCDDPKELLPVSQVRGVVSRGNEYWYTAFSATLPNNDGVNSATATISIDNVDRQLIPTIRTALSTRESISVLIEVILNSIPNVVEYTMPVFRVESVQYDAEKIDIDLVHSDYSQEPFPKGRFVPSLFTGLF